MPAKIVVPVALCLFGAVACSAPAMEKSAAETHLASAEPHVMVGGAPMYPSRNIVQNAVNSDDHKTLVAAVKQAGLVDTLSGPGPFIVFAPTDEAFAKLPPGTVETLMRPENKQKLTEILTYHVVPANADAAAIRGMVADDNGAHPVPTVNGQKLTAKTNQGVITLTDANGRVAAVTVEDVIQSNGVIHVIDTVMLPK